MKKMILAILLNSYLFGCIPASCISHGSNCYGLGCISHQSDCYGDGCIANVGSRNSLPQSIIDQYQDVIFTRAQQSAISAQKLANLQQQLEATNDSQYIELV
jgi:hypothetical protein